MTTLKIEAYREKLAQDILQIDDDKSLYAIRRVIERAKQKKVEKVEPQIKTVKEPLDFPCYYTEKELKSHLAESLESYANGEYLSYDNLKRQILRWK